MWARDLVVPNVGTRLHLLMWGQDCILSIRKLNTFSHVRR